MKTALSKLMRNEKGQALPIVLVLLLIGSLFTAPLLGYMGTGLIAGQVHEDRMEELYAADAGVEDALWRLKFGGLTENETLPQFTLNNKTVDVTVDDVGNAVYRITAVATSSGGANTTIESYVSGLDFSFFLNNAITSGGAVDDKGVVTGNVTDYYTGEWPTADQLSEYYLQQVDTSSPFADGILDIKDYPVIMPSGSLYREGDLLITNTGTAGDNATLNGIIYVAGDLDIKGPKDFYLDLNDQTIFVEGEIYVHEVCTFIGSGCIIAVGDIDFGPKGDSNPDDFIFIMSVEGTIKMNPKGDFYGSLAGNVEVTLQPGYSLVWQDWSGEDLEFPTGDMDWIVIRTWEINPQ